MGSGGNRLADYPQRCANAVQHAGDFGDPHATGAGHIDHHREISLIHRNHRSVQELLGGQGIDLAISRFPGLDHEFQGSGFVRPGARGVDSMIDGVPGYRVHLIQTFEDGRDLVW